MLVREKDCAKTAWPGQPYEILLRKEMRTSIR